MTMQKLISLFLATLMQFGLSACQASSAVNPEGTAPSLPQQQEDLADDGASAAVDAGGPEVKSGTETYRDFLLDNVLYSDEGEIIFTFRTATTAASRMRCISRCPVTKDCIFRASDRTYTAKILRLRRKIITTV